MAEVKLVSLTKSFGEITAIDDMNLEVGDKEFFVLLGPTGAGKTTTLRLIAGLEKPDEGEVRLDGVRVNELSPGLRDVAFVFQQYTLYPNYTVRQNLEFPLRSDLVKMTEQEIKQKVLEVAKILHIEHLLGRGAVHLSGGEMQRVSIGRAIVRTPKIFLMDEPLSNLDANLREEMRTELARLHFDLGSTFLYVTHDQIEAMTMGDRVAVLNNGKIHQIGGPEEIYNSPKDVFVAKFVGSPKINLMDASVDNGNLIIGGGTVTLGMTDTQADLLKKHAKKQITVGIRPGNIQVAKENGKENTITCSIYFKEGLGAEDVLNLRAGDMTLKAIAPPRMMAGVGETVYATIDIRKLYLFDLDTGIRIV